MHNIYSSQWVGIDHVARHFAGVSEFLRIQCLKFPDDGSCCPFVRYQDMAFFVTGYHEVTAAAVLVLGQPGIAVEKFIAVAVGVPQ